MTELPDRPDRYEVTRLLDALDREDKRKVLSSAIENLEWNEKDEVVSRFIPNARPRGWERTQSILSLLVVGGFVVTLLVVIFLLAMDIEGVGTELLQTVASIYSGLTGAVVGYFFGKGTEAGGGSTSA